MSDNAGTVWVQVGGVGVRVPEADGVATAGEIMATAYVKGVQCDVGAIHEADCSIGRSQMEPGGGTCDCSPSFVKRTGWA